MFKSSGSSGSAKPSGRDQFLNRTRADRQYSELQSARRVAELERAKGIEPSYAAWEAAVLPLNYARLIHQSNQYIIFDAGLIFLI
jgi:hypothetical protein